MQRVKRYIIKIIITHDEFDDQTYYVQKAGYVCPEDGSCGVLTTENPEEALMFDRPLLYKHVLHRYSKRTDLIITKETPPVDILINEMQYI